MPFIKEKNQDFYIVNNRIELSPEYLKNNKRFFKKITGSRFSNILGFSKFNTPVQTWAAMVNIFKDTMDPILAKAGNVIEPKVRDYVVKTLGVDYKAYEPAKINWDMFPDNEVFGGIPDGEPVDASGNLLYPQEPMLEIKTTSIDSLVYKRINNEMRMVLGSDGMPLVKKIEGKREQWYENGRLVISDEYKLQLGLYLYLRKIEKGLFAVCFLKTEDYVRPEACDVEKREVKFAQLSLKHDKILSFIKQGEAWYNQHILTGVSPELTAADREWLLEHKIY